jgi:cell division septation protein DedD
VPLRDGALMLIASIKRIALMGLLGMAVAPQARAQAGAGDDSIVVRVQRFASDGNPAAARALVDSVLVAAKEGSTSYVNALFARASIAESADAARKDYLRIALDYSISPRAEDALLRLAQLEIARGDRAAAKQYLERLALEHPAGVSRAQGAYWLGRVLLDDGAVGPACVSLVEAKARVAASDVELANQITYYARPCAAVRHAADSARADSADKVLKAARADSVARADSITRAAAADAKAAAAAAKAAAKAATKTAATAKKKGKTVAAPKGTAPNVAPSDAKGGGWSAQVAAYDTREEGERLAKKLSDRGYETRVTNEKPFRVRIGRYSRRAEAIDLVAKLKDAKITAIVVEAEKP